MSHTHLTKEDRFKIQAWKEVGKTQEEIAVRLNKSPSAISKELTRNPYANGRYDARHAHRLAQTRRRDGKRRTKKLVHDPALAGAIISSLRAKRSPEQIAGRRKRLGKKTVCHETIYQYLYTERRDLIPLLRQKKGKYRRRHGTKARAKRREILQKTWITERPTIINERKQIGHWEGDTIRGKEKITAIATHVERVSGYGCGDLLLHATAARMREATVRTFQRMPKTKRLSETIDNGFEFAEQELTERALGMTIYSALPYHSWERGTNENFNGLLREYFPKGSAFAMLTQERVATVIRSLNNRPRKRLNYLTPYEVFVQGMTP